MYAGNLSHWWWDWWLSHAFLLDSCKLLAAVRTIKWRHERFWKSDFLVNYACWFALLTLNACSLFCLMPTWWKECNLMIISGTFKSSCTSNHFHTPTKCLNYECNKTVLMILNPQQYKHHSLSSYMSLRSFHLRLDLAPSADYSPCLSVLLSIYCNTSVYNILTPVLIDILNKTTSWCTEFTLLWHTKT